MSIKLSEVKPYKGKRARTVVAAVLTVIDKAIIGEPVVIGSLIDYDGSEVKDNVVRMAISNMCKAHNVEYITRKDGNGDLVFVRYT